MVTSAYSKERWQRPCQKTLAKAFIMLPKCTQEQLEKKRRKQISQSKRQFSLERRKCQDSPNLFRNFKSFRSEGLKKKTIK